MEQALVTVVVISYNQARYIEENLDSILAQTYPNIELIVADDASQDNSVEVFEKWLKDNDYTAAFKNYHQVNTGLATMLNECIEKANGKYLKLIAADDFLHPESLQKCVAALENAGDNCGMVFTDTFAIDDEGNFLSDITNYENFNSHDLENLHSRLLEGNCIAALTVLMRTEAVRTTGFYSPEYLVEDYFRWLKISEKYQLAFVREKLAYYRMHNTNISISKARQIEDEVLELQMLYDRKGARTKEINQFLHHKLIRKDPISPKLKKLFLKYPFGSLRLKFFLKYKIPVFLYRLSFKLF